MIEIGFEYEVVSDGDLRFYDVASCGIACSGDMPGASWV